MKEKARQMTRAEWETCERRSDERARMMEKARRESGWWWTWMDFQRRARNWPIQDEKSARRRRLRAVVRADDGELRGEKVRRSSSHAGVHRRRSSVPVVFVKQFQKVHQSESGIEERVRAV